MEKMTGIELDDLAYDSLFYVKWIMLRMDMLDEVKKNIGRDEFRKAIGNFSQYEPLS